ncbi:hypothetical protein [Actinomadura rubrisoli]|uniref:Uncharacterized protein n=1 Tax=Actinomadura rubrisoli TaxID=2530368 RepID=A0A4R5B6M7_9ACTN|nr:hypothetical protein [Actinomadura rubrisoli]TDD81521.1 hypothetical protein E1298_24025 [Actinomadura rubrisoli]
MNAAFEIQRLLAPLSTDEDSYLRVRVGGDPQLSPAELLYPVIFDPAFPRGPYFNIEPPLPSTVDELAKILSPISARAEQILSFLVYMCTTDVAFGANCGPWTPSVARPILLEVMNVLQPGMQWWSNVEYPPEAWEGGDFSDGFSSYPVTGHTLDCALVGIGHDATVTFLAYGDT